MDRGALVPMYPAGQIAFFRIYPERRSRLHFHVRIFASQWAMRRYAKAHGDRTFGRGGRAMCSTWTIYRVSKGRTRITDSMGEILLPTAWLGAGVIAHECTHAALHWARRIRLDPDTPPSPRSSDKSADEERFCYGLGELTRQIALQLYDRRILVEASDGPRRRR